MRLAPLLFAVLLFAGCSLDGGTHALTTTPGTVIVVEYDRETKVLGEYHVDGTKLQKNLGTGELSGPGLPHPVKNYSVDR